MARVTRTQHLTVGDIEVELTRRAVRNINLRVRRDGTVAVSAAPAVSQASIEAFVASRASWIAQAQERMRAQGKTQSSSCRTGETVMVWGEARTVRVEAIPASGRAPRASFTLEGDELVVRADERIAGDGQDAHAARVGQLDAWFAGELRARAGELLPRLEARTGRSCSQLRFRAMSSRWGSCNVRTAAITLNTRLAHYHPHCLENVLVHELCHLFEPRHNARFYALMDRHCPGWRAAQDELDQRASRR